MIGADQKVKGYFHWNNINLKENCKVFGSMEFGGLSNYWGLQMDPDILSDIKNLSFKVKKDISKSFLEILSLLCKIKLAISRVIYVCFM